MTKLKELIITIAILCALVAFLNWQNGNRAHGSTNSNGLQTPITTTTEADSHGLATQAPTQLRPILR